MVKHSQYVQLPGSGLTLSENERLVKLNEECSEVIKEVCKTQLHGYESYDPNDPLHPTNKVKLETECKQILMWIWKMHQCGDIDLDIPTVYHELPQMFENKRRFFKFQE